MNTIPETGTALATIRTSLPTLMAADKDDLLLKLKAEIDGFEPDTSTKKGREQIASMAMKPRRVKAAYTKIATNLKEDAQATIRAVNAENRQMSELLDGLAVDLRRPLDEIEATEAAIERDNEAAIKTLEDLAVGLDGLTADEIKQRYLTSHQPFPWAPTFAMRADRTIKGVVAQLQVAHQAAKDREAAIEAERISNHRAAIDAIPKPEGYGQTETCAELERRRSDLGTILHSRTWDEFFDEAVCAIDTEADRTNKLLDAAYERAAEAQKVRDAAIAAEATRLAEIEAARQAEEAEKAAQAALQVEAERTRMAEELAQRLAVEAEANRVAGHRNALAVMERLAGPKTADEAAIMVETDRATLVTIYDRDWQDFADEAASVRNAVAEVLMRRRDMADAREIKAEADRKEAQRIRDEAAQTMAEAKARQDLADQKAAEERALAGRMKRHEHLAKINGEVLADLLAVRGKDESPDGPWPDRLTEAQAKAVIRALAKGEVRHATISY